MWAFGLQEVCYMNKTFAAGAIFMLLAIFTPANASIEPVLELTMTDSAPEGVGIVDGLERYECNGSAPDATSCTTGSRTRTASMNHGPANVADDFTGYIQSSLEIEGGGRFWTCQYENGVFMGCVGTGSWPPVGAQITHNCRTFYSTGLEQLDDLLIDAGIEGGAGDWGCQVTVFT